MTKANAEIDTRKTFYPIPFTTTHQNQYQTPYHRHPTHLTTEKTNSAHLLNPPSIIQLYIFPLSLYVSDIIDQCLLHTVEHCRLCQVISKLFCISWSYHRMESNNCMPCPTGSDTSPHFLLRSEKMTLRSEPPNKMRGNANGYVPSAGYACGLNSR